MPALAPAFVAKLDAFVAVVEAQVNADTAVRHTILHEKALENGRRGYHHIGYDLDGRRFIRVWDQTGMENNDRGGKSVKFFVEIATGIIWGTKSWKVYNPLHRYGTLDTLEQFDWSGYRAVPKPAVAVA